MAALVLNERGLLSSSDKKENEFSVEHGFRILLAYEFGLRYKRLGDNSG